MKWFALILACLLLAAHVSAEPVEDHWTADLDTDFGKSFMQAAALIESNGYQDALKLLEKLSVEEPGNADVFNLLGFAYRNTNNFERSMTAYNRALLLNPDHKGALEYQGELYIMLGRLDKALENLDRLELLCPIGCEELEELKTEIEGMKNG